ncbi:hypothetical protein [Steroidobacter sp.]|uniref:hypothetical protein n=1 Tax=Steroidobacter sp. TaxID=1978227 RepID=UPI001A5B3249|nr:hypothetical protein [Steroidobacter sp.]MBL8270552.1 hypothetical protein [Steroidobacter sp.]
MISYNVFLDRERLPAAADWARLIREAGFEVQLSTEFEPHSHSGYLPCPDERTGFEYYLEAFGAPAFEIGEIGESGAKAIGQRNAVASLRFSGRPADRTAAIAAAATLTAMTDGVLFDTEPGHFIGAHQALAWARNERYQPVATYRRRAMRRKARLTPAVIVRLLIIVFLALAVWFLRK